ncbi:MAG: hypothetical protein EOO29_47850, partial [Comamonadaceae bacterium]
MHRAPVPVVVQQHVADAAVLRNTRAVLVAAPHVRWHQLARLDERLAAHLDGLAVAGDYGVRLAAAALDHPGRGEIFVATVLAIESRDLQRLGELLSVARRLSEGWAGVASAFGWVPGARLQGITKALLESPDAFQRQLGLAGCAMHGVDPGPALTAALSDEDAHLRRRALRVTAQIGRIDLLPACMSALDDGDAG